MSQPVTLNRIFGKLTVARFLTDDLIFCTCACGGSRQVKRKQLTSGSVDCCRRCAKYNRLHLNRRQSEPPLPPEPAPAKIEPPRCNGKVVDGFLRCGATTCPKHGVFGSGLTRAGESHLNGGVV